MSNKVWYCSKCGNIHVQEEDKCPECESLMKETAASEIEWKHKSEKDREIFTNSAKSLWGSPEPEERTADSTEYSESCDLKLSKSPLGTLLGYLGMIFIVASIVIGLATISSFSYGFILGIVIIVAGVISGFIFTGLGGICNDISAMRQIAERDYRERHDES